MKCAKIRRSISHTGVRGLARRRILGNLAVNQRIGRTR